ncbi:hypothetical protein Ancab_035493, partial [Ancistrocladus abbreviatus]
LVARQNYEDKGAVSKRYKEQRRNGRPSYMEVPNLHNAYGSSNPKMTSTLPSKLAHMTHHQNAPEIRIKEEDMRQLEGCYVRK